MKNFEIQKGDNSATSRHLKSSSLLDLRHIQTILHFYLLLGGVALLVFSCKTVRIDKDEGITDITPVVVDSSLRVIHIYPDTVFSTIRKLDLMVYEDGGTYKLIHHSKLEEAVDSINIALPKGGLIYALIANYPESIANASLQRYDSLTKLQADFRSDDKDAPIMSVWGRSESERLNMHCIPMMSRVKLVSVSNLMDDYELLENPRVRLCNINSSANILQYDPFTPSQTIDYGEWHNLPYDIGTYAQRPDITMYCYPSSDVLSVSQTAIEFECYIKGKKCSFVSEIPRITRNSLTLVELSVEDSYNYDFRIVD